MPKSCLGKVKRSGKSVKHGQYRYKCSVFECLKIAVTNGLCHQHGAPRTTCKFIDWPGCRCKKQPKKNGMCKSHIKLTNWKEWLYKQSHEKIECDWGTSATKSKYNSDDISNDADNGVWDISRAFDSGDKQSKYNYIIDETAMTCDDGVAGKGVQDTTATSGVEKLNNIDASTIEIPSDRCGSDDYEMTFESRAMISNDDDTDNNETADTTCADGKEVMAIGDDERGTTTTFADGKEVMAIGGDTTTTFDETANTTCSNDCNSDDIDDGSSGDDEDSKVNNIIPSISSNDTSNNNSPCRSERIEKREVRPRRSNRLLKRKHGSNGVDTNESSANMNGTMRAAAPKCDVKLKVMVDGEIICPHLGEDYPRGNMYRKKEVTQYKAARLQRTGQLGGRVVSLLYDEGHVGFCPKNWRFFVGRSDEGRWLLLPSDGDKEGQPHPLYVHRSKNVEENSSLYEVTKTLINNHPQVRNGEGWDGVGSMIGVGEHLDMHGKHCNFVLKDEKRHMWTDTNENLIMMDCGQIFEKHFGGKDVGYHDMIAKQKTVWPTNCPSRLSDHPRSYSASCNLGNELHRDNDAARSFAVWVNEKGDESKSWYLLFPEWEVAIEVTHGTWISWNGRYCGHCTAVPNVAAGDSLLSLFCTIPQRLYTFLKKKKDGENKKEKERGKTTLKKRKRCR